MKSKLKIYTSFVSPLTLHEFMEKDLLPIFIVRNISNSELIGNYSRTPVHCYQLSPSTDLYRKKRDNLITEEEFEKLYAIEMSNVDLESIVKDWELLAECSGAKGLVLLNYGSSETYRKTLRDILNGSEIFEQQVQEILL